MKKRARVSSSPQGPFHLHCASGWSCLANGTGSGAPMKPTCHQAGFTLVELAIVLICLGIVSAAVLKGQSMIRQSRIAATIAQVQSYQQAFKVFQETYHFIPGDMPAAQAVLPNCTTATNCTNGNGNAYIGDDTRHAFEAIDTSPISENVQAWKHMALAGLVSGVDPTSPNNGWGTSHPGSPFGGGYHLYEIKTALMMSFWSDAQMYSGRMLTLQRRSDGGRGGLYGARIMSPGNASMIDRKIDDGLADAGFVKSSSSNLIDGCGRQNWGVNGPSGYAEGITLITCEMYFDLR